MDKIKEFFGGIFGKVVDVLGAIIGILVYIISLKSRQNNALKAKIELADTHKQADLIEVEIKEKLKDNTLLKKEVDNLNTALVQLENQRSKIEEKSKNQTPKEAEDYWNDK